MTVPTAYKRLSDARTTLSGVPRLGLAAGLARKLVRRGIDLRKLEGVFSVEVDWDAQPSRPRAGLLVCHFSTSYQATISGVAYRDHGKVAVGRSEGRASAEGRQSRPIITGDNRVVKGLKEVLIQPGCEHGRLRSYDIFTELYRATSRG